MVRRLVALLVSGLLVGCEAQALRDLDRELSTLIRRQQQESLGPEGVEPQPSATAVIPDPPARSVYERRPETLNPPAGELPALTGIPATQPDTRPAKLNLEALLPPPGAAPVASMLEETGGDAAAAPSPEGPTDSSPSTRPAPGDPGSGEGRAGAPAASQPAPTTQAASLLPEETDPRAVGLDLDASLAHALQHSRDYRNRKDDLYLAAIALLTERHLWGPRFFDTFTAQVAGTPETGDHDHVLSLVNELGVTQRLPFGGSVSASALVNYVALLHTAAGSTADDAQTTAVVLEATLPLLRDAGQAAREDLIQAERNLVYATRTFEQFRRSFIVDLASSYYGLLLARSSVENRYRQMQNLRWLAHRTEALARAGRLPYFEVQRSEQQVLFALNDMLNARERYASQVDSFKLLLGMPAGQPVRVVPSQVVVDTPVLDRDRALAAAVRLRLDLQTSADQVADARRRVEVARNQLLPDAELFGDVTVPTDPGRKFGGLRFDAGQGGYNAGLRLDLPLDRYPEKLGVRSALISLERNQRSYSLLRDQVVLDVRRGLRQIEQAQRTLEIQGRNIELGEKRLRGVLLRLRDLGPRDFIEAESNLLDARDRYDSALRDLRVSILQYLRDSGQLRVAPSGHWITPGRTAPVPDVPLDGASDAQRLLRQMDTPRSRPAGEAAMGEAPASPAFPLPPPGQPLLPDAMP